MKVEGIEKAFLGTTSKECFMSAEKYTHKERELAVKNYVFI